MKKKKRLDNQMLLHRAGGGEYRIILTRTNQDT